MDSWGRRILLCEALHCRMFSSIPALYLLVWAIWEGPGRGHEVLELWFSICGPSTFSKFSKCHPISDVKFWPLLHFVSHLYSGIEFFFFLTGSLLPTNKSQFSYLAYRAYTKFAQFTLLASFLITCAQIFDNLSTLESLLFPKYKHFAHVLTLFLLLCLESP